MTARNIAIADNHQIVALVMLILLVDGQLGVVGHILHWVAAVVEALAGLAVPVPDEAEALAPFERRLIQERTKAGLALARARGRMGALGDR